MRFYSFSNMYLSSIQVGIQSGHVIAEMAVKYCIAASAQTEAGFMFENWAENHKVMILLNGGYGENLHDLYTFFDSTENPFPFDKFNESKEALDGAVTSVGIVLPAKIYKGAEAMRQLKRLRRDDPARMNFEFRQVLTVDLSENKQDKRLEDIVYTQWEIELMERLGTFRLA